MLFVCLFVVGLSCANVLACRLSFGGGEREGTRTGDVVREGGPPANIYNDVLSTPVFPAAER